MCAFALIPSDALDSEARTFEVVDEDQLIDNSLYLNKDFLRLLQEDYYCNHVNQSATYYFNRSKFQRFYEKWMDDTAVYSSVHKIMENENFRAIVDMQIDAIPFIVAKLESKPDNILWALNMITKSRISNQSISMEEASMLWVNWGRANKII